MGQKPAHEIRIGRVKALIWENEIPSGGIRHAVTVQRLYRKNDGWQTTSSFDRDDLPLLQKVADIAHTWIYKHPSREAPAS